MGGLQLVKLAADLKAVTVTMEVRWSTTSRQEVDSSRIFGEVLCRALGWRRAGVRVLCVESGESLTGSGVVGPVSAADGIVVGHRMHEGGWICRVASHS